MRRLTVRDGIVALVAVLIPYIGYLIRGDMPFIQDARGMASAGLISLVALGLGASGSGAMPAPTRIRRPRR